MRCTKSLPFFWIQVVLGCKAERTTGRISMAKVISNFRLTQRSVFSIAGCLSVGCCDGGCRSLALSDDDAEK
jgi:hypothetical protein